MKDDITQRFIEASMYLHRNGHFETQRELAELLETTPQALSDIRSGRRHVSLPMVQRMSEMLGVRADYLLRGELPVLDSDPSAIESNVGLSQLGRMGQAKTIFLPMGAVAGYLSQGQEESGGFSNLPRFSIPQFEDCDLIVPVMGDSMYPTISNGDLVICKQVDEPHLIRFGDVYFLDTPDGHVVKRLHRHEDPKFVRLVSDNENYETYDLPTGEIRRLWLVKGKLTTNLGSSRSAFQERIELLTKQLGMLQQQIQRIS